MKRPVVIGLVIAFLALLAIYLVMQQPTLAGSLRECESAIFTKDQCYRTVAIIKGDEGICQQMSDIYREECAEAVKGADGSGKWPLRKNMSQSESFFRSYPEDEILHCATNGRRHEVVTYTKDYLSPKHNPVMHYYDPVFTDDCASILNGSDESSCSGEGHEYSVCVQSIRLVNDGPVESVCNGTYYPSDCYMDYALYHDDPGACGKDISRPSDCFYSYAIKFNDSNFCGKVGHYGFNCWFYFALKDSNASYCDMMEDKGYAHYCHAVLLAEQGQ